MVVMRVLAFFFAAVACGGIGAVAGVPIQCQPANAQPLLPTFHVVNAVFINSRGNLEVSHLNDANAIFEYKGIYHAMCQGNMVAGSLKGVNWTHAVSNDLIHWYRVKDALESQNTWNALGSCDGTLSFPSGQGEGPIIMYTQDCSVPLHPPVNDYPRVAVARPTDGSSPHLLDWSHEAQVTFDGEPCSFPGKVWKSEVGNYWNMLCSPHWDGNWGDEWARYEATDPSLLKWKKASKPFLINNGHLIGRASGAMFNPIPNAAPGGPTHMIQADEGQSFFLGTYDPKEEVMNVTTSQQFIDISGGGNAFADGGAHWAATSNSFDTKPAGSDNRLLWVAWVQGLPNVLSLVREISYDRKVSHLISTPVAEYAQLRNATFVSEAHLGELQTGTTSTLPIPRAAGGALDVSASFDLSAVPAGSAASGFGLAVRAPASGPDGAAQNVAFFVTPADAHGVRNVTVGGKYQDPLGFCARNICPSNVTQLFPGELLDVRVLVDRPVTEVFVLGGRIAWVHADHFFSETDTSVHVYNHGSMPIVAKKLAAHGMGCGWRDDLPMPKGGVPNVVNV